MIPMVSFNLKPPRGELQGIRGLPEVAKVSSKKDPGLLWQFLHLLMLQC